MAVGIVSILYGLCAGLVGYFIGVDIEAQRKERNANRSWYRYYMKVRRQ